MSLNEFNIKYGLKFNFLQYNSIIAAIKKYTNNLSITPKRDEILFQPALNIIMTTKSGTSPIYKELIRKENKITGLEKWSNKCQITKEKWIKSFRILNYATSDTKIRWLQIRILHHCLTTNRSVAKYNPDQSHLCSFCKLKSETIIHLLWECKETSKFWKNLANILNRKCLHSHNFRFTPELVLFGISDNIKTDKNCILIILLAKYYVYRCKVQSVTLNTNIFVKELYHRYSIERIINKNSNNFKIEWAPYENIFKSLN